MIPGAALALALAASQPFSTEDLLALPRVSSPAISPDGATVLFTVSRPNRTEDALTSALFSVPSSGGRPRRLLPEGMDAYSPRFSPDGRSIAFVGVAQGDAQAWVLGPTGRARKVTALHAGVDALAWTPDGRALLVVSDVDPACGADAPCNARAAKAASARPRVATRLLFRHWSSWRERVRSHVLLVPLAGGAPVDLTPGDRDAPPWMRGGIGDLAVSPDGRTLYFTAVSDAVEAASTNADLYAVPLEGGAARRLTSGPGWDGSPRPSPDGERLAWRAQLRAGAESDRYRIFIAATDGTGARDLTPGIDLSVEELYWVDGGRALRFIAQQAGRRRLFELEPGSGAVRPLTGELHLADLAASPDGRFAAAVVSSFTSPPEVALLEPASGPEPLSPRRLTSLTGDAMARVGLGSVRPFEARAKDGTRIPGWIVTPPGHRPGERHPAVLLLHGGPEDAWLDEWHWRWNAMLWSAQGFTLVMPNPRGSTGYGQPFVDAVRNDWNGAPFDDVMAFLDAAVAAGEVDDTRVCAAGASYGGYLAHVMNGRTDRFRCLISHASLFDVELAWYGTDELWFPEWEFGLPWSSPESYARASPRRTVERWRTPSLVTHGELDYRVSVGQALGAFAALQRLRVESRLVVFPDEGHWIQKPRNARAFHEEAFGWLRRFLGGTAPPK
jgi:dipeptidyl aminopeptidase/acylaminoacyl peptidase